MSVYKKPRARAESHEQERARKLCSATLKRMWLRIYRAHIRLSDHDIVVVSG